MTTEREKLIGCVQHDCAECQARKLAADGAQSEPVAVDGIGFFAEQLTALVDKAREVDANVARWRDGYFSAKNDVSALMEVVFEGMEPGPRVDEIITRTKGAGSLDAWKKSRALLAKGGAK